MTRARRPRRRRARNDTRRDGGPVQLRSMAVALALALATLVLGLALAALFLALALALALAGRVGRAMVDMVGLALAVGGRGEACPVTAVGLVELALERMELGGTRFDAHALG